MKGMRYPDEVKSETIKYITECGYSVADVAKNLGVSTKSLHKWRQELVGLDQPSMNADLMHCGRKLPASNAALRRATEERGFLKKVAAFFARQPE